MHNRNKQTKNKQKTLRKTTQIVIYHNCTKQIPLAYDQIHKLQIGKKS